MAPARMRTLPSIAHRLALVAAGEAAAAISLHRPGAWDYGAGHALLRGAGATLVDEAGAEIAYGEGGRSRCRLAFAGSASVARGLAARDWREVDTRGPGRVTIPGVPARLPLGAAVADAGLSRPRPGLPAGPAQRRQPRRARRVLILCRGRGGPCPNGPRLLADGGHWGILAGQPTDDSEMALALARTILDRRGFDAVALRHAYVSWIGSGPFDAGRTVTSALNGKPDPESQANGALMRASPLGLLAHAQAPAFAAEVARRDAELTHPNPACLDANAAFVVAVAHAVRHGDGAEAAWQAAHGWAKAAGAATLVLDALEEARSRPPVCDPAAGRGWVRVALQNAFYELLHAPSLEAGVVATVRRGGDTDTNAAITGALLGAVHGRDAIPRQWRSMVLSCRPLEGHALRPRPPQYWPADVLEIAERLLIIGQAV